MPKLASFEDWVAPWETATGTDSEIDKPKLRKYLHNLLQDKERLQESVATVTTERDALKKTADEKAREGESDTDKLKRENKELQDKLAAKTSDDDPQVLRLTVALEKGLTASQAKRLVGNTKDELMADADELVQSFGGQGKTDPNDGSDAGDDAGRRKPRRVINPGDPKPDGTAEVTFDKAMESIPRLR